MNQMPGRISIVGGSVNAPFVNPLSTMLKPRGEPTSVAMKLSGTFSSLCLRVMLLLVTLFVHCVMGFGYLSFPPATYRDPKLSQVYTADMNTSIHPMFFVMRQTGGVKASSHQGASPEQFVARFAFADYSSLRAFADEYYPGCGNSNVDDSIAPANVYNASTLMWRNEDEKFGFYQENDGPCETWVDDERVQYSEECARSHPGYPGKVPIDFSRCAQGSVCVLRFYWFAVEKVPFKLMKHCVKIINDPNTPAAEENTDPSKIVVIENPNSYPRLQPFVRNESFSVDLTLTWEKLWLTDSESLGGGISDSTDTGTTILVIP